MGVIVNIPYTLSSIYQKPWRPGQFYGPNQFNHRKK